MSPSYDAIIVGSGAGGSAAAYTLVKAGKRVLMLEKGGYLPRDGSTLDVQKTFKQGLFKSKEIWRDAQHQPIVPEEYYNVGGKTKWYGAALLRFSPHEFGTDADFKCLGWPISYDELAPYYKQAETLLQVNKFANKPQLQRIIDKIVAADASWEAHSLPLGLKHDILLHAAEAKHFDGFASPAGFKGDAENNLLKPLLNTGLLTLLTHKEVVRLLANPEHPTEITGVRCAEGCTYDAPHVILAAGAMSSPRLLQLHLNQSKLAENWPSTKILGANFKLHLNTALLAFSPLINRDMLRKTAIFFNEKFPHSTVQCLGWMDGEILATQLPSFVPRFITKALGTRAYGFFLTTEDGSSLYNRIIAQGVRQKMPTLDYNKKRTPASLKEHNAVVGAFKRRLLGAGLVSSSRPIGLAGTAHALGSMVTGNDPENSVVDAHGRVHGFYGLYVADGSILPRSSRVNPALTIYAWGLRLGQYLAESR